jgi:SagB-type dehydrogenase family enzyme
MLFLIAEGGAFTMKDIKLPEPGLKGKISLESAIYKRRSVRSYANKDLTLNQISQLLWAAQGITDKQNGFRSAPSAGALYPITIYVVKKDGLFEYIPQTHSVRMIVSNDLRNNLFSAALGQGTISEAPIDIVITADYRITESKYGSRADRYVALEAGHIAQNVLLQATALGLAGVPIGAFYDNQVKGALYLEKDPIYIIPIGYAE